MANKYFSKLIESDFIPFVKYGIVGVLGLLVDMGVFYIMNKKLNINYVFSNIISSSLAVIHNFVLNSYFTFKMTDKKLNRFFRFYLIALGGMVISTGLLVLFIDILGIENMLAKFISILLVAFIQYFLNKNFTFRSKKIVL